PVPGHWTLVAAHCGWLSTRATIFRPVCEMASTMRSGSFHSKPPLLLPSMLRHSNRCFTQWKPPSLASWRSRAVVAGLPHRNTWTEGSVEGTLAPASGEGDGAGETAGDAAGDEAGLGATAGAVVGAGGGAGLAQPMTASR